MKWLSSLGSRSSLPPSGQVRQHTSLALNALLERLPGGRKHIILDLGPACGRNIEFFSHFSCKIYIEALHQTLNSFDFLSPEDGVALDRVFRYLLPFPENTRFDAILSWDLFNYLERDELHHLVRHLARFCCPGSLLMALISTNKLIPERPGTYRIQDRNSLLHDNSSGIKKPCPQYGPVDFKHLMPDFTVCCSFVLRNGFREYLFALDK
ncbi:MAG: hypothetical protein ACE5JX_13600 [Acidobacteriota bacterium]